MSFVLEDTLFDCSGTAAEYSAETNISQHQFKRNKEEHMVEVLAPAGTAQSFRAAIAAGADAVYLGGERFGARAYAGNFGQEELLRVIDYAHVRGRKVYLTVNTLLKEKELEEELYAYLKPFYQEGLDAVIVQDYGVFLFVRENFPDMDIHASTQMTITGPLGAGLLAGMGASRVVTARELSFKEIAAIRREVPELELESFVHGALCYCYSGQCLMSSLMGGRSGNRGRCAQACRLAYDVLEAGRQLNREDERHVLCPKDMCTLELLPKIIRAGVNSLKIEGRMKSPEYTAGVVRMYRKYVDIYLEKGEAGYQAAQEDVEQLMDLYNRGNFTSGYYQQHNGREMMAMSRPNHQGVRALQVVKTGKGFFKAKALTTLHGGDVIEAAPGYEITIGAKDAGASVLTYNIPLRFKVREGQVLYRTKNGSLLSGLKEEYVENEAKRPIDMHLYLQYGQPARLELSAGGQRVTVTGMAVSKARNRPVTREELIRQLSKLGESAFMPDRIDITASEDVFIPMGALNELRRLGAARLEKELCALSYRTLPARPQQMPMMRTKAEHNMHEAIRYSVYLTREQQLEPVLLSGMFHRIYLDVSICPMNELRHMVEQLRATKARIFLAFPHIFRERAMEEFDRNLALIKECGFDGYLVKSLCALEYVHRNGLDGSIVADHMMYVFNGRAGSFLKELLVDQTTIPIELNERELSAMELSGMELMVYGFYPMMVSAQCIRKNFQGCGAKDKKEQELLQLRDRKAKLMTVDTSCRFCYSTIYNECPVNLSDKVELFRQWGVRDMRITFTIEDRQETEAVLCGLKDGMLKGRYTRGHFARGVE